MSGTLAWQEIESKVQWTGQWLVFAVGVFFLLGGGGFFLLACTAPPDPLLWVAKMIPATCALVGGVLVVSFVRAVCSPVYVRHASLDVLPGVPNEPMIVEGAIAHGRLTHELCETDQGWELRPMERLRRNDMRFLVGFGIVFIVFCVGFATWWFSVVLSWLFHGQLNVILWMVSVVGAIIFSVIPGGLTFMLIGGIIQVGYRKLSKLTIPRNGNDLECELGEATNLDSSNLLESLQRLFVGEDKRRMAVPRNLVAAVQLCPYKIVFSQREIAYAVQGLLVLATPGKAEYHRLPILLTSDFVGAARLMQKLAQTLEVPYLFCADAAGWKAEAIRAKTRRLPVKSNST